MKKRTFYFAVLVIAGVGVAFGYLWMHGKEQTQTAETQLQYNSDQTAAGERTIATSWRWDRFDEQKRPITSETNRADVDPEELPSTNFDITYIYDKLQTVRLSEEGSVIVDDEALKALNETLDFGNLQMNEADLLQLQELIRTGLPGEAGEQTAKIVVDYYRYLGAKAEFDKLYQGQMDHDNQQAQFEELVALREMFLGPEVAANLFEKEDDDARYMMESMQLAVNQSLTDEEKTARQQQISQRYHQNAPPVQNWETRYQDYLIQRQHILDAGLERSQQEVQLQSLVNNHFSSAELATIKNYGHSLPGIESEQ